MALSAIFKNALPPGERHMAASTFVKVCQESGLLNNNCSAADAREIFEEVKSQGTPGISAGQFDAALDRIAKKKIANSPLANYLSSGGRSPGSRPDSPFQDAGARYVAPHPAIRSERARASYGIVDRVMNAGPTPTPAVPPRLPESALQRSSRPSSNSRPQRPTLAAQAAAHGGSTPSRSLSSFAQQLPGLRMQSSSSSPQLPSSPPPTSSALSRAGQSASRLPPAAPPPKPAAAASSGPRGNVVQTCGVCMEDMPMTALIPCGHVACGECIARCKGTNCPFCRAEILKAIVLYNA
eukprot:TRINITY_DN37965_c0_g1_i1.p1 TRINITY_DN37965_c0_g1~~TRINITY_DN37965_c0_g1_i1.p1  ORF type:complete len:296 (+),score=55.94 TRINITY_DN37965_c0_g1_i1:113-1000(+)